MSHTQVQWARGTSAQVLAYTGPAGEVVVDTDDYSLAVQDGATAGGYARLTPGIVPPHGRLTLTSGTPVLASDVTAAATLYYTPFVGRWCPLWNGNFWQQVPFIETSLALDSNSGHSGYQASGSLFDVFAFLNSGTFTIGTGPAWTSTAARGSGVGTTQLQLTQGIWTNAVSITLRFGNASGNTVSVPANQAVYVGTLYATANGQTAMQFKPAPAAGGNNSVLGLYNAWNRVRLIGRSQESTANWTYNSATVRNANNSASNRVTWIDGLAQSPVEARAFGYTAAQGVIGVGINSTSAFGGVMAYANAGGSMTAADSLTALGLNFAQALEASASGTVTFYGNLGVAGWNTQAVQASLEM